MSYLFDADTDNLINSAAQPVPSGSFTMLCWIKVADATPAAVAAPFSLGATSTSADIVDLQLTGAGTGRVRSTDGTSTFTETTDGVADCRPNEWFAIAGLFTVDGTGTITEQKVWTYNGLAETSATSSAISKQISPWFTQVRIGESRSGSSSVAGYVAHCATWKRLLTDAELTELTTKAPNTVATADLWVYWPLLTGLEETWFGGGTYDLTNTGATLVDGDGPTLSGVTSVTIASVSDSTPNDGQTGVTITGTGFGATQGAGKVYISPTDDVDDAGKIQQTVTSWSDTSIEFTAIKGTLSFDTNAYLFVVTDGGQSNASGAVVQIAAIRSLKALVDPAAAGATNVSGVVFAAPAGSDITGAKIGEFTGASFEASLESGQAVLKVLVSEFGGEALTTSDTPVVLARNTDYTTGLISATVINE